MTIWYTVRTRLDLKKVIKKNIFYSEVLGTVHKQKKKLFEFKSRKCMRFKVIIVNYKNKEYD